MNVNTRYIFGEIEVRRGYHVDILLALGRAHSQHFSSIGARPVVAERTHGQPWPNTPEITILLGEFEARRSEYVMEEGATLFFPPLILFRAPRSSERHPAAVYFTFLGPCGRDAFIFAVFRGINGWNEFNAPRLIRFECSFFTCCRN